MSELISKTRIINGVDVKTPQLIDPPKYSEIGEFPKKLIVCCVWWGTKYSRQYVEKLRNSVSRNISMPFEMVCITDRDDLPENIIKINALDNGEGWWQKVNLFKEDVFPKDARVLFLDLDVVITGSLDSIVRSSGEMIMIENFAMNRTRSAYNSSCMVWTPNENTKRIYECFSKTVTEVLHGDQCWIWRVMDKHIRAFEKDLIVSYKYENRSKDKRQSKNTSVWVFHGKPDPHEVKDEMVVHNWR